MDKIRTGVVVHADIHNRFGEILEASSVIPARALEVGGRTDANSLLRFPKLDGADRYCVNLEAISDHDGIKALTANGNDLHMFTDGFFDLVVSNATLEHDPFFWRSLSEMRRVLKPGGLLIIGVPGIVKDHAADAARGLPKSSTLTYRFHMQHDYYRFTTLAVRTVFFEAFKQVRVEPVLVPPRIIGYGYKPRVPRKSQPPRTGTPSRQQVVRAVRRRASRLIRRLKARA